LKKTQKRFKVKNKLIYKKEFFPFCRFTCCNKNSSLSEGLFCRIGKIFFILSISNEYQLSGVAEKEGTSETLALVGAIILEKKKDSITQIE